MTLLVSRNALTLNAHVSLQPEHRYRYSQNNPMLVSENFPCALGKCSLMNITVL